MTIRARIERFLSPTLGTCFHCMRPWRTSAHKYVGNKTYQQLKRDRYWGWVGVESHDTEYKPGRGMFPLCKGCWSKLTIEERIPYYQMLIDSWKVLPGCDIEKEDEEAIINAVKAGK